ncbi:MAG: ABC transporter permease, partial [Gemmataceae bacterium]
MTRGFFLALGWLTLACLTMPVVYTFWVSFSPGSFLSPPVGEWSLRWYRAFVDDGRWSSALFRSLVIGVASAGVALFAGVPLAFALGRHRFLGSKVLAGAVLLPACVPPAALGMGMLPLLYMVNLWGNPVGLVLAHGLLSLPFTYLVAQTQLGQINPDLELAARGLGAGPWQTTLRVTLPLLRPALLAGSAAAFALSLNESMLALFLA